MNTKKVIVVDDEVELLEIYKMELESHFQVVTFDRATAALDYIVSGMTFDALISDIVMPDMTGLEFIQKMRESGINNPVIVMTGYANKSNAIKSLELGVFAMLEKPYDKLELIHTIKRAIASKLHEDISFGLLTKYKDLTVSLRDLLESFRRRYIDAELHLNKLNLPSIQDKEKLIEYLKLIKETNEVKKIVLELEEEIKSLEKQHAEIAQFLR